LGWWYYIESNPVDPFSSIFFLTLTSIGGLFQASLMGLFFLMGGFLTPKSYDRKGARLFWKERLLRLGIPLLLYVVLINPIMHYTLATLGIQPWRDLILEESFLEYYFSQFQSLDSIILLLTSTGPMWFLYVLLIFTFIYTLWRQITKFDLLRQYIPTEFSIPRYAYLLLVAIILGCATYLIRLVSPLDEFPFSIPFALIIPYLMMFCVGVIAIRYDWFEKMSRVHIKVWSLIIAVTIALFFSYFIFVLGVDADLSVFLGGPTLHALVMALVENIISMGMIFVLIPIFRLKFNHQGPFLQSLSASSYHMYLIHAPILVAVSLLLASISLFPAIKLTIVFIMTIFICYLASHFVVRRIL
jgi:hypothetical protein